MAKKSEVPLQKVTLNLELGDKDTLTTFHPVKGWSVAAREVIHRYCDILRERDSQDIQSSGLPLDVDVPAIREI